MRWSQVFTFLCTPLDLLEEGVGGSYIDTSKLTNTLLQKLFFAGSRTLLSQFGQFRVLCIRFLIIITFLYYPYERMTAVADTLTTK